MKRWMYLSFARKKTEGGFLGGAFVFADSITDAIVKTHSLGINPGGNIAAMDWPEECLPDVQYRHKLLSKEDITKACGGVTGVPLRSGILS